MEIVTYNDLDVHTVIDGINKHVAVYKVKSDSRYNISVWKHLTVYPVYFPRKSSLWNYGIKSTLLGFC